MTYNKAKKKFIDDFKEYLEERSIKNKSNAVSSLIYLVDNYMDDLVKEYGSDLFLTDINDVVLGDKQIFTLDKDQFM